MNMDVIDKTAVSEKDFHDFFMKSPVGRVVVSVEPDSRCVCTEMNIAAASYFDIPREKMLGRTAREIFDAVKADLIEKAFQKCIKTKRALTLDLTPRFQGGVRVQTFILNPVSGPDGNVRFIDITARPDALDSTHLQRERDDALMMMISLFDASGLGIVVTDHHGRIMRLNDIFMSEYGWKREDLLGEEFTILVPPEDQAAYRKLHAMFIKKGRKNGVRNVQIVRKDGSVADAVLTTALLELSQKRRFMVASIRDVTERKNMMRNLKRAKEEADSANRAKSAFLANMSHELRTPLNAIIGFSELMKNQVFGPINNAKYEEYMKDIHFSSRHLLDIINDVLDMSKIEAGRVELIESEVAVADLFASMQRIMGDRARAASVELKFQIEEGMPPVKGDQRLLRQILINLVSNAVKFSPPGKKVDIRAFLMPDKHLRVAIEDEGCGIPADKIKVVQEPFGQVNDPRHYRGQGTGLGLPLAKAMMELHSGYLLLESQEGKGTKVYLDFPIERMLTR